MRKKLPFLSRDGRRLAQTLRNLEPSVQSELPQSREEMPRIRQGAGVLLEKLSPSGLSLSCCTSLSLSSNLQETTLKTEAEGVKIWECEQCLPYRLTENTTRSQEKTTLANRKDPVRVSHTQGHGKRSR